jgi:hypothetical protein
LRFRSNGDDANSPQGDIIRVGTLPFCLIVGILKYIHKLIEHRGWLATGEDLKVRTMYRARHEGPTVSHNSYEFKRTSYLSALYFPGCGDEDNYSGQFNIRDVTRAVFYQCCPRTRASNVF